MQEWFVYFEVTHPNGIVDKKDVVWMPPTAMTGGQSLRLFKNNASASYKVPIENIIVKSFNKI
ncbi:TPA: hypothetical protein ACGD7M_002931 [Serratia marcescens]